MAATVYVGLAVTSQTSRRAPRPLLTDAVVGQQQASLPLHYQLAIEHYQRRPDELRVATGATADTNLGGARTAL
jgi:hypothetical protein